MVSSEDEDEFVTYGTPLEPLEEDEIPTKKPFLPEDQTVRDKQGRRRFHGAFTGGFSAGFFNTVGSLEGWKPASFKSSKSEKHDKFQQKPEDYMDEEDLGEFGIAPTVLRTKDDYMNSRQKSVSELSNKTNFGAYIFNNILKPARETVGLKLLAVMGWKPGQGIGPRKRKREKRKISALRKKVYGCKPASLCSDEGDSESDHELEDITFAPSDYEPYLLSPKDNFFGIGYEGLQRPRVAESSTKSGYQHHFLEKSKKHMSIHGQGFGVGAFEEEDDDIYSKDDLHQYDFSLGNDNNKEEKLTKTAARVEGVLEGFTPQINKQKRKQYQLPVIPKNFNGQHKFKKSRFSDINEGLSNITKGGVVKECKFVSSQNLRNSTPLDDKEEEKPVQLPFTSAEVKTYNFQPFCFDPAKQERFEAYLKLVDEGNKDKLSGLQPLNMTDWAKEKEKLEFDQASKLLKPLTGTLNNRFQPATKPDDISDPLAVVEKYCDMNNDCMKAAKMKMFGALTRSSDEWSPCSLLSKRFNLPEVQASETPKVKKPSSRDLFSGFTSFVASTEECVDKPNYADTPEPRIKTTAPEEHPVERAEEQGNDLEMSNKSEPPASESTTTTTTNKIDLFRAIFLDGDDENEAEEEEERPKVDQDVQFEEVVINSKRNTSPPRGLFENIELETFFKPKKSNDSESNVRTIASHAPVQSETKIVHDDAVYGPKIPEKIEIRQNTAIRKPVDKDTADEACWVEKSVRVKKHKKKDKKHKKSKHKSKHKKKEKSK